LTLGRSDPAKMIFAGLAARRMCPCKEGQDNSNTRSHPVAYANNICHMFDSMVRRVDDRKYHLPSHTVCCVDWNVAFCTVCKALGEGAGLSLQSSASRLTIPFSSEDSNEEQLH